MRVPEYGLPEVAPQNLPGVRQESVVNADMLGVNAKQVYNLGQAVGQAGDSFAKVQIQQQDMANQVRLNDAKSQLLAAQNALTFGDVNTGTRGFQSYKSKDALSPDPDSGQPLDATYADKLKTKAADIAAGLSNDAQRRAFAMVSTDALSGFQGQIQRHMLEESNTYARETNTGTIKLAGDTAALNWNNPDLVAPQIESAKAAAYSQAQHDGLPPAATTMAIKDAVSGIHRRVIETALEQNNPAYAMAYKDKYKDDMSADDTLAVLGRINHQVDAFTAQGVVNNTTKAFAGQIQPTDMARLLSVRDALESGGKDYNADGTPVVSAKGAKYKNQVMPATAANPGFGIKPAADDSPAEYNRVGDQLMAALVTKYGDVGKALAAYNAGSGAVDVAIKTNPANWLGSLPKETQDYVQKGVSKFNTGADAPVMPTKDEFVTHALGQLPQGARPELVKLTRDQAEAQYKLLDDSRKEQGDRALEAVQKALVANGGNYSALPAALTGTLSRFAPGRVDDAMKFAKAISNGENNTNTEAYAMAVTYPGELAKMTDATFVNFLKTNFSVRDQEKISRIRAEQINGKTDDSTGALNTKAMNDALANRLVSFGITMPTAKSSTDDKARVGAIQKYVADDIFAQQQQLGRKMTKDEISKHIDQMFLQNLNFKTTFLGIGTGTSQTPMLTMKVGDIPATDLATIKTAFANRGVSNPTNDMLIRAYWTAHKK